VNLVTNPSFETNLSGWAAGPQTKLTRVTTHHSGSWAVRVARTKATGDAILDDSPNTVTNASARPYAAAAWVSGSVNQVARLLVNERRSDATIVRTTKVDLTLTDGAWHHLMITVPAPAAGNRLDLRVVGRSMPTSRHLDVDDVELC
jgi:hypothetical protein